MKLGARNILIVTNRPAIANSWYQDYETFFGPQSGYIFASNVDGIKDRKFVYSREEYIAKLNTTLANFDTLVPDEVFWEVTVNPQNGQGVTLDQFRMLRDGGDYVSENGEQKHFDGHLFDEVVFNDAVQEFMKKRAELANYFEPDHKGDIFDFIPPQRTNQIFTPKKVVKDMVDRLEQENPGCFDDPDATFADLYMKSGMYVTEIVTRLYQSKRMKALYPDEAERLNHIFAKQVFGCAPTEIIYRICLRYILGFSNEIHIEKNNIRLCDTLEYAKNGTMDAEMRKLFDL